MTDTKRTAADIGLPVRQRGNWGMMPVHHPEKWLPSSVWVAGDDALALRDKLTAAEALLRDLTDMEGPQPGNAEWYQKVQAWLTEGRTDGN